MSFSVKNSSRNVWFFVSGNLALLTVWRLLSVIYESFVGESALAICRLQPPGTVLYLLLSVKHYCIPVCICCCPGSHHNSSVWPPQRKLIGCLFRRDFQKNLNLTHSMSIIQAAWCTVKNEYSEKSKLWCSHQMLLNRWIKKFLCFEKIERTLADFQTSI